MTDSIARSSRLVADELRRAERSINTAARDTAQFLLTAFDVTETHNLSPAFGLRAVKATVDALAALVESQHQLAMRAHPAAEKAGTSLGLTIEDWGEGAPKPNGVLTDAPVAETV